MAMKKRQQRRLDDLREKVVTDAAAAQRFSQHVPAGADAETTILKSHLVLEEGIRLLVLEAATEPSAIIQADLTFFQLAQVARAFVPSVRGWMWDGIIALNEVRNDLAHDLDRVLDDTRLHELNRRLRGEGELGYASDWIRTQRSTPEIIAGIRGAAVQLYMLIWVRRRQLLEARAANSS
jgi:hypothetical protein